MSSFIVDDNTIHRIVSYLRHFADDWERKQLQDLGYNFGIEGCSILGNAMLALNKIATGMRYDETPLIQENEYKWVSLLIPKVQELKSLCHLLDGLCLFC